MGYGTLLEKFCFFGEEAKAFDERISDYCNNNSYLLNELILGDQLTIVNKTYKLFSVKIK